uniref:Uncharacterized protein n=1 Tax=Schizaphis graminum TaxID=13262 RepID=A0A2S2N8A4_SCHGA
MPSLSTQTHTHKPTFGPCRRRLPLSIGYNHDVDDDNDARSILLLLLFTHTHTHTHTYYHSNSARSCNEVIGRVHTNATVIYARAAPFPTRPVSHSSAVPARRIFHH